MISKKFGPQASSARRVVPATPQTASTTRSINSETSSSSRPDLSDAEPTSPHAILLLRPVPQRGATPKTLVVTASPATEARHDLSATPERQATPGRGRQGRPSSSRRPAGRLQWPPAELPERRNLLKISTRRLVGGAPTGDLCAFLHTTPQAEASVAHEGGPGTFPGAEVPVKIRLLLPELRLPGGFGSSRAARVARRPRGRSRLHRRAWTTPASSTPRTRPWVLSAYESTSIASLSV